ncbi:MAG: hypothetical protein ACI87A_001196 [Planctomycetota bacterium]|jgi:hypothetical protein
MFFRRISKALTERAKSSDSAPSDQRLHYRQNQLAGQKIEFLVCNRGGMVFEGAFQDASVNGTSALFTLSNDPGLKVGEIVDVFIAATKQESHVRTPAKVTYVEKGGEQHWRYAFEFMSVGDLYSQLDEYYSRVFNRRQHERVRIPPEQAIRAKLIWGESALSCRVSDISAGGMSTVLPEKKALQLESIDELQIQISLPRSKKNLNGGGTIRTRNQLTGRRLFGIQFELETEDGFRSHCDQLERFIEERRAHLERWEQSIRSA